MELQELSFDAVTKRLRELSEATSSPRTAAGAYAMYSSFYGGLVKETGLMLVPIDDHIVHRGDGIFEAIKCVDGQIYGLDRHLDRLARSAELVSLKLAMSLKEIHEVCVKTVQFAVRQNPSARNCLIRLYNSRGPGGFTTNPYETIGSQLYVVATPFHPASADKYERGVSAKLSSIAVKEGIFATVKSCNYLPNVLMKKEAVDFGVDYTISKDQEGWVAEGSTENFAIVSFDGRLLVPGFERTLRGITASRAMELAEQILVPQGLLVEVTNAQLTVDEVLRAKEVMVLGTTIDCLGVTRFEGRPVADGRVGPVTRALMSSFHADLKSGPMLTPI